jgi:hypothetical protein
MRDHQCFTPHNEAILGKKDPLTGTRNLEIVESNGHDGSMVTCLFGRLTLLHLVTLARLTNAAKPPLIPVSPGPGESARSRRRHKTLPARPGQEHYGQIVCPIPFHDKRPLWQATSCLADDRQRRRAAATEAAQNFPQLRAKGVAVRQSIDTLIALHCILNRPGLFRDNGHLIRLNTQ